MPTSSKIATTQAPSPAPGASSETNPRRRRGRGRRRRNPDEANAEENPKRRRRRRRHNNPRRNPMGRIIAIAASVAAVAGGITAYVIHRRRKKALPPVTPGGGEVPGGGGEVPGGGGGGGGGSPNYVGSPSGWTNWPHKDSFPTEKNFIILLKQLGYTTNDGKGVLGWENMAAVHQFQIDYNKIQATPGLNPPSSGTIGVDHITKGMPKGKVGGLIGSSTANAMYNALVWSQLKPWHQLLQEAP